MGSAHIDCLKWSKSRRADGLSGRSAPLSRGARHASERQTRAAARRMPARSGRNDSSAGRFKSRSGLCGRRRGGLRRNRDPRGSLGEVADIGTAIVGRAPPEETMCLPSRKCGPGRGRSLGRRTRSTPLIVALIQHVARVRPECRLGHAAAHGGAHPRRRISPSARAQGGSGGTRSAGVRPWRCRGGCSYQGRVSQAERPEALSTPGRKARPGASERSARSTPSLSRIL